VFPSGGSSGGGVTRYVGKVRDVYLIGGEAGSVLVMVATGRQSAFDRHLAAVPFKSQVLNEISLWWFEQTKHIVPNYVLSSPHPSCVVGRRASVFPIEFVVRGFMAGSTATSMWSHYKAGSRFYCGHALPEGMVKNQRLWVPALVTPTTKSAEHDEPISAAAVVSGGLMSQADWDACEAFAKRLFEFGSEVARDRGLILVDTKYEFGKLPDGSIVLCDELHTPDSSRYWISAGYEARFARGEEPHSIDKEFLRQWFVERCDPYADAELPPVPPEIVCELSRRYVLLYELITQRRFAFPSPAAAAAAQEAAAEGAATRPDAELAECLRKAAAQGKLAL
jgi:phosphoribosylaminoimidazole-succinocarboxamide synthase